MGQIAPTTQAIAVRDTLASPAMIDRLRSVIPATAARYLTPDRITKIVLQAMIRNPKLMECTQQSILAAVMDAAALGLEPSGGVMGHAYLVPYRNKRGEYEAQLIIGYRGLIALARRSGEILSVEAHVVHERDTFECSYGDGGKRYHKPCLDGDPGKPILVWCRACFRDGGHHDEVMTIHEVDAIRRRSRSGDNGPWATDYEEMGRKTVVRRAAKYWPISIELAGALDREDAAEDGVVVDASFPADGEAPKPRGRALAEKVRANGHAKADQSSVADLGPARPTQDDLAEMRAAVEGDDWRESEESIRLAAELAAKANS